MSSTTPTPVRPLTPEGFKSKDEAKKAFKVIILLGSILAFVDFFTIWTMSLDPNHVSMTMLLFLWTCAMIVAMINLLLSRVLFDSINSTCLVLHSSVNLAASAAALGLLLQIAIVNANSEHYFINPAIGYSLTFLSLTGGTLHFILAHLSNKFDQRLQVSGYKQPTPWTGNVLLKRCKRSEDQQQEDNAKADLDTVVIGK